MLTQKSETVITFRDAGGDKSFIGVADNEQDPTGESKLLSIYSIGEETGDTLPINVGPAQALAVGLALVRWAQTGVLSADPAPLFDSAFHPRAMKLILKQKKFLVVACDEPYFAEVYARIRQEEQAKGTWTEQDDAIYLEAIAEDKP